MSTSEIADALDDYLAEYGYGSGKFVAKLYQPMYTDYIYAIKSLSPKKYVNINLYTSFSHLCSRSVSISRYAGQLRRGFLYWMAPRC